MEIDDAATCLMQKGIRLMMFEDRADVALQAFDVARELRQQLPPNEPLYMYGLAACWLNRAEALARLGACRHAEALAAYDEALALLGAISLAENPLFTRRLAVARQNRAMLLASNMEQSAEAIEDLRAAISVLDGATGLDPQERDYLLAVARMNLANMQLSMSLDSDAQLSARQALELVSAQERHNAASAEVGIKTRHILCRIAARRQVDPSETSMLQPANLATLVDSGLELVRAWECRGVVAFRSVASDLSQFRVHMERNYGPLAVHI